MNAEILNGNKVLHHAFSVNYNGIVREIFTDTQIAQPSVLFPDINNKKFVNFKAIWDTGATNTVITQKVVDALNLMPTGKVQMFAVNNSSSVDTYIIDLGLPMGVLFQNVNVLCGDINNTDILIGMDIIQSGDFSISNANGKTHFSYCLPPHTNPVCLVEKSNKVNKRKK